MRHNASLMKCPRKIGASTPVICFTEAGGRKVSTLIREDAGNEETLENKVDTYRCCTVANNVQRYLKESVSGVGALETGGKASSRVGALKETGRTRESMTEHRRAGRHNGPGGKTTEQPRAKKGQTTARKTTRTGARNQTEEKHPGIIPRDLTRVVSDFLNGFWVVARLV